MVRLMLTLTPVVCILSAVAFSECFTYCLQDDDNEKKSSRRHPSGAEPVSASEESADEAPGIVTEKKIQKNLYDKVSSRLFKSYENVLNVYDFFPRPERFARSSQILIKEKMELARICVLSSLFS